MKISQCLPKVWSHPQQIVLVLNARTSSSARLVLLLQYVCQIQTLKLNLQKSSKTLYVQQRVTFTMRQRWIQICYISSHTGQPTHWKQTTLFQNSWKSETAVIFSGGDAVFCFTHLDSSLTVPVGPARRRTSILSFGILKVDTNHDRMQESVILPFYRFAIHLKSHFKAPIRSHEASAWLRARCLCPHLIAASWLLSQTPEVSARLPLWLGPSRSWWWSGCCHPWSQHAPETRGGFHQYLANSTAVDFFQSITAALQ